MEPQAHNQIRIKVIRDYKSLKRSESNNRRDLGVIDCRSLPIDAEMSFEKGSDYTVAL